MSSSADSYVLWSWELVDVGLAAFGGVVAFSLTFCVFALRRRKKHADVRIILRLASVLAFLLFALSIPLFYIAAFKGNPVSEGLLVTRVAKSEKTWLFWYPRGLSGLVCHGLLGSSVEIHPGVGWLYFVVLLAFVGLDATSSLVLANHHRCILVDKCNAEPGYGRFVLRGLYYRDLVAVGLQTWAILLVGSIAASGISESRYPATKNYVSTARAELLRCGFLDPPAAVLKHKPFFGINGKQNVKNIPRLVRRPGGEPRGLPNLGWPH